VKWAQGDKTQSRELLGLFICVCSSLCTILAHNTAQNKPDNFPSCPPDNHHCSDDDFLRERGALFRCLQQTDTCLMASFPGQPILILMKRRRGWQWHHLDNIQIIFHLAPDRQPCQHLISQFITGRRTNSVKAKSHIH